LYLAFKGDFAVYSHAVLYQIPAFLANILHMILHEYLAGDFSRAASGHCGVFAD
jgi:hypothetical protein